MTPRAAGELVCDVVAAGGGPAGAAVACRLAMLGYHVVLVAAGRPPGEDRSETLPPSIALLDGVKLFDLTRGGGPVPEPATWAMMLLGFGGVGAMIRSRRRRALTA